MPLPVAPRDVHAWIKESLAQRCDIGFWNALSSIIFEPRNPFGSTARRKPRTGFMLGMILFAVSLGCFCYFIFAR
jgi:hypothetical protein